MNGDDLLKQNAAQQKILHEVQPTEVKLDEPRHQPGLNATDILMLLGPISFIMGWTVLFFMLSKIGTVARNEICTSIKHLQRVPCRNCQFFSNNAYLKCAVQPSIVLTEKALNCCDYRLKQ